MRPWEATGKATLELPVVFFILAVIMGDKCLYSFGYPILFDSLILCIVFGIFSNSRILENLG
jgi:hypothetical protein